jgi:DNA (cytosine-5)-methyltransferase 1
MRYLSVCSGIGTDQLAAPAHWSCAGFAEIDPFARAVLAHRFPEVPLHDDFTTLDTADVGPVDLVVGGTPCQSFSVAGKRLGIDDPRGNLTIEFVRLGIRLGARWLFWENVPGVLSSNAGSDFGSFLEVLADGGYQCAWRVLDAQHFGVPQRRRRVYLVACRGAGADVGAVASVLFERNRSEWHPPARRTQGQGVAGTVGRGSGNRGWAPDTDRMTFVPHVVGAVSSKWAKGSGGPSGDEAYNLLTASLVASTLGADSGAGRRYKQAIAFTSKDAGGDAGEVAPTLRGGNHVDGNANGGVSPAVAFDASDNRHSVPSDTTDPVRASGRPAVASETVVRRPTPLECERLQGLPDGHTAVPFRGRAVAADGNRYRAIGNGWAVPVVRWLFARLDRVHVGCQADG